MAPPKRSGLIVRCRFLLRELLRFVKAMWRNAFAPWAAPRAQNGGATINQYERRWMSQNGEDGIIAEIFKRIGTTSEFFVEFGVEDGLTCNCAFLARHQGWGGLFVEGADEYYRRALDNYRRFDKVKVLQRFLTAENILETMRDCGVPHELDLLSIDVDGNDYWLWSALRELRPRVVVIEYNAAYRPPARWVMEYKSDHQWDGSDDFGASLAALCDLADATGYDLIGTDRTGTNAFFMRSDITAESGLPRLSAEQAYHDLRFWPVRKDDIRG